MNQEPTNKQIFDLLNVIQKDLSGVKEDLSGVKKDVSTLKDDVSGLKNDVSTLKDDVSGLKTEQKALDIKMELNFKELKMDNKALDIKLETNLQDMRNEIINHVDSFVKLHKDSDTELAATNAKVNRNTKKIDFVMKKLEIEEEVEV